MDANDEDILRRRVQGLADEGNRWVGYLTNEDSLREMERDLLTIGVSYKTATSHYRETDDGKRKLMFSMQRGNLPLSLDVPFRVLSVVQRGCLYGKDKHKTQEKCSEPETCGAPELDWTPETFARRKAMIQGTKKKGCTAFLLLKRIELFPDYKVHITPEMSEKKKSMLRADALSRLMEALSSNIRPTSESRIYLTMSKRSRHINHDFEAADYFGQTVDTSVIQKIYQLVQHGITSVQDIRTCLKYYVQDVLLAGSSSPNINCRAFHPTNKDIMNHVQNALRKDRCSTIDQENAEKLVEEISAEDKAAKIFFRPYSSVKVQSTVDSTDNIEETCADGSDVAEAIVAKECSQTLRFCYQSEDMAKLLQEHGSVVACLDATNKTSDYAVPLFFKVVKTAVNYMVAGIFITQFETADSIAEALGVFQKWCPQFSPQYWVIDCSQAEMAALHMIFPQSEVMLCSFHREQAWNRWLQRKENGVTDVNSAKSYLRRLADASSEEEFKDILGSLMSSSLWENEKFQDYLSRQWLPLAKMWVNKYHRQRFGLIVTSNNGTETQNKMLKELYLNVLVRRFIPDRLTSYKQKMLQHSSNYRQYHNYVPGYLHNRPPNVIKHIMNRLLTAQDYATNAIQALPCAGMFNVVSSVAEKWHTVDFNTPLCTCEDFCRHKLPCKHFCAVFLNCDGWGFQALPPAYRNSPHMVLHELRDLLEEDSPGQQDLATAASNSRQAGSCLNLPRKHKTGINAQRLKLGGKAEKIKHMAMYCTDIGIINEVNKLLEEAEQRLMQGTPTARGLLIRGSPVKGCSGVSQKRAMNAPRRRLLQLARSKSKQYEHWRTRGRVGKAAELMRHSTQVPESGTVLGS